MANKSTVSVSQLVIDIKLEYYASKILEMCQQQEKENLQNQNCQQWTGRINKKRNYLCSSA